MNNTTLNPCTFRRIADQLHADVELPSIDADNVSCLRSAIVDRLNVPGYECNHLFVDFTMVEHAGSRCLSLCLELHNIMKVRAGSMTITGLNRHVAWLFESMHLQKVLNVA